MECVDFGLGDGTECNPYQITNNEELYSINCHMDSFFILMNDLYLSNDTSKEDGKFYNDGKGWLSLGDSPETFIGNF